MAGQWLSPGEQARLSAYRHPDAAMRYTVTRVLVRHVLAKALGVPPADVVIRQTDLGKPITSGGVHFNVSHSGDLVVLAVCRDRAVGIDVERRRAVERIRELMARWLSPAERQAVEDLVSRGSAESDAFLQVWSRKEAALKALGVGLAGSKAADSASVTVLPMDSLFANTTDQYSGYVGAVALV